MGTSQFDQVPAIIEAVGKLQPKSILDVGCGYGKYGFLCREILVCWKGYNPRIDAIEGHAPYIGPLQYEIYNTITIGDALSALKRLPDKQYDLVLAIEILEHFNRFEGEQFLEEVERVGINRLISTPKMVTSQDAIGGNELEIHKTQWADADLGDGVTLQDDFGLIKLVGPDAYKAKRDRVAEVRFKLTRAAMRAKRVVKPFG